MIKTTFLMALLTVLLVTPGGAFGGEGGMVIAFLLALSGRPMLISTGPLIVRQTG